METERQIQKAINCITGKRTIIAIAHRLSTIRNADLILVIQEGEIIERGTHDQLMAQKAPTTACRTLNKPISWPNTEHTFWVKSPQPS